MEVSRQAWCTPSWAERTCSGQAGSNQPASITTYLRTQWETSPQCSSTMAELVRALCPRSGGNATQACNHYRASSLRSALAPQTNALIITSKESTQLARECRTPPFKRVAKMLIMTASTASYKRKKEAITSTGVARTASSNPIVTAFYSICECR